MTLKPTGRAVARAYGVLLPSLAVAALAALTAWSVTRSDALDQARAAYARRDLPGALDHALSHLLRRPWSREAARLAARCLSALDYPDQAEPYYRRAGALGLDDLHTRAYALVRANRREAAAHAYDELLSRWPDNVTALRRLAALRLIENNRPALLELADRLIHAPAGAAIGYTLRGVVHHDDDNPGDAVAAFEHVLELDPELKLMPLPRELFWSHLAKDLIVLGRVGEARRHLTRAVAERDDDARLMTMLGRACRLDGDLAAAALCFRKAEALDPKYAFPRLHLGQIALQRGEYDEALDHLRAAETLAPNDYQTAHYLALALRQKGRADEAERWQRRADDLRRHPPAPESPVVAPPRYAL